LAYCPRSSLPAKVLAWLASRLAHLTPPRPRGQGGTPPLPLEVRLDAVAAVLLDGLSYRRAGRAVGSSKTEVGDSLDLLLPTLAAPGSGWWRWLRSARRCAWTGWPPGCSDPAGGPTRRCCTTPSATPTPPKAWRCRPSTATCCGAMVGWPGGCHEQELLMLSGLGEVLDASGVATIIDRGFRGMAKGRERWHAPVGDRRTKDRLTDQQRAFNRMQAGLRALVEQAIGHLANAWALRRWRGLLYRVRDVFRAVGALVCLGRWLDRIPT